MFCKKCGKEIQENSRFCSFCGQNQDEPISGTEGKPSDTSGGQGSKVILAHRGTMILIFGIIGIVCCCPIIFSLIALIMAVGDLKKMKFGLMDAEGMQTTRVGMILGIIGLALTVLSIIFFIVMTILNGSWITEYRNVVPFRGLNP